MIRLEVGGGPKGSRVGCSRGGDWVNMDMLHDADIVHDLEKLPWPVKDDTVSELYSSHCIEHVKYVFEFLKEVARVCVVGAPVEIRCPDATSEMAMCAGHSHVVSITVMRHMSDTFPDRVWKGLPKRLKLLRVEPGCDDHYFPMARANSLFKDWSDLDIMTWLPRTRHENRFHLRVEKCDL